MPIKNHVLLILHRTLNHFGSVIKNNINVIIVPIKEELSLVIENSKKGFAKIQPII